MLVEMMSWPSLAVQRSPDVEAALSIPKSVDTVFSRYPPSIPLFEVVSLRGSAVSLVSRYMPLFPVVETVEQMAHMPGA
jgi:hypothetical protein